MLNIDQKWRKLADGTMELVEEVEVNRDIEINLSIEDYLLDLEFRVSIMELGL